MIGSWHYQLSVLKKLRRWQGSRLEGSLAVTELFHGSVRIHTLKWDFRFWVMLFPFIFFAVFHISTHASKQPRWEVRHRFYSQNTLLFVCVLSSITGAFVCPVTCQNTFFRLFVFLLQGEGSSHILHFVQPNFPIWFWPSTRQIRGSLMKGKALVGILFVVFLGQSWRLMSTSTPGLSSRPVNDDKWQAHDHEDESQSSKACGLKEWKERERHLRQQHI